MGKHKALSQVVSKARAELDVFDTFKPGSSNQEWRVPEEEVRQRLNCLLAAVESWILSPTQANRKSIAEPLAACGYDMTRGYTRDSQDFANRVANVGRALLDDRGWANRVIETGWLEPASDAEL